MYLRCLQLVDVGTGFSQKLLNICQRVNSLIQYGIRSEMQDRNWETPQAPEVSSDRNQA